MMSVPLLVRTGVLQNLKAQKVGEKVCTPSVML